MSLRAKVAEYVRRYPSVGFLRLVLDLAPAGVTPGGEGWRKHVEEVERSVRELAKLGLVSFNEELGVVSYKPFLDKGWAYAGGEPPWLQGEERVKKEPREKREAQNLLAFLPGGGDGGGRG